MSTSADPVPIFEELLAQHADLWVADVQWDDLVREEPEPWGMGPTPLTLMIDRLTAELPATTVEAIEAEVELERLETYGDEEVNDDAGTDAGTDRPVLGADVADGPEGSVVVEGDGPGDPDDQG